MIGKKQKKLLNEGKKWLTMKSIATILLSCLILTSAGMFTTTARATDEYLSTKDNMIKAYNIFYEGHNIGVIRDKEDIESILEDARREYETKFNMETVLIYDIDFEEIYVGEQFLSSIHDLEKVIRVNVQPKVKSAIIEVDGQEVAILNDRETVQSILDSIQEPYKSSAEEEGIKLEKVSFEEDINIKDSYVEYGKIEDPEKVLQKFIEGEVEKQIYTVEEGDNVWTIAGKHKMTVRDLLDANAPLEESDILQIGQELNLNVPDMLINVLTVEEVKYTESIPFETETKKTDSLYINQSKVSQEGKNGELEMVDKVYKRNGIEKDREKISETVIKEPVKKIVLEGTKKPVKKTTTSRGGKRSSGSISGSGSMSWPTRGSLSSRFGQRNGRLHKGIDLACPKGTPIYAADSGTISYSKYNSGGYGNLVKISHGGGIVTYYAHMSSRSVSQGQSVKKGQLIGYVGNTGNSRGNHLHFEVRVNGSPKNPFNYLR